MKHIVQRIMPQPLDSQLMAIDNTNNRESLIRMLVSEADKHLSGNYSNFHFFCTVMVDHIINVYDTDKDGYISFYEYMSVREHNK